MYTDYSKFSDEDRKFWDSYPECSRSGHPNHEEYWSRIKAKLPARAPRFLPGDLVYCYYSKTNTKVVRVNWDAGFDRSFWRISIPGYSAPSSSFSSPSETAPTDIFEETRPGSNSYAKVDQIPPKVEV